MKKNLFLFTICVLISCSSFAQQTKLYDPQADAAAGIEAAVKKAAAENKFVVLQGGGTWCKWCIEFERFCKADKQIDSVLQKNFIVYYLNWSKENENRPVFEKYGYAQRFGFPVFIVLNSKGERIHTQNSEYLEDGKKSYDKGRVFSFLEMWSPGAFDPAKYNQ